MSVSPFDSDLLGPLFSDSEVSSLFSDDAAIRAMAGFEAALARVQGRLGIIPAEAAQAIAAAAASFTGDKAAIGAGAEASGVPVVAFVQQLREAVGGEAAAYVHWGATSQDVVDTALVLRLRGAVDLLAGRLDEVIGNLAALADAHRGTVMAGRTRAQQAVPITFGLKAAGWLNGLAGNRERLGELRPRLLVLQFGGAAGNLSALGGRGVEVMEALAAELDLACPVAPWSTQRENMVELANWLSLLTGSVGKMGQDLMLLAHNEVAEVRPGAGGGSSTMPQKANPVGCEAMVAAAQLNAALVSAMHQAMLQEHERGGPGWMTEWATLPQMVACAGGALKHAVAVTGNIEVHADRMRANLDASNGLLLAEAAGFALSEHMPRPDAQALVKRACLAVADTGRSLFNILPEMTDAPVDWKAVADPTNYLGVTDALIDQILAKTK